MYTVEELHQSYNDWYELIWVGDAANTFEDALQAAKNSHRWRLKITRWEHNQRQQEWHVQDGELQQYCEGCYTHHDVSDFASPQSTYCNEHIEQIKRKKDDW